MDVIEQVSLLIPEEALPGLADGTLYRDAGVIRDVATKQFVMFLDEAEPLSKQLVQNNKMIVEKASKYTGKALELVQTNKKAALAIGGTVVAVSAVAAVGYTAYRWNSNRRALASRSGQRLALEKFSSSMADYWKAVQTGSMTQGILNAALSHLEALQAADVQLDPENAAVQSTVGLLRTYTDRLVAANPSIDVARDPALQADDPLVQLHKEIRVQQILFNRALGASLESDSE